jgi:hypothetical protein
MSRLVDELASKEPAASHADHDAMRCVVRVEIPL